MSESFDLPETSPLRMHEMKSTFDRFTGRARQLLAYAQEEAARFNHHYIGTEHLLLGVVRMDDGIGVLTLVSMGVKPERVREAVEEIIAHGDSPSVGDVGLTPRAKRVIELAVDEARLLKQRYVCTEHILLGLIREGEGIAAKVLATMDVTWAQARAQIAQILPAAAPSPKTNVVMCRLDDRALDALDILIEAGICATRSEAAAWLIQAGIDAQATLFAGVASNVAQIRRLREETQRLAQQAVGSRASAARAAKQPVESTDPPDTQALTADV